MRIFQPAATSTTHRKSRINFCRSRCDLSRSREFGPRRWSSVSLSLSLSLFFLYLSFYLYVYGIIRFSTQPIEPAEKREICEFERIVDTRFAIIGRRFADPPVGRSNLEYLMSTVDRSSFPRTWDIKEGNPCAQFERASFWSEPRFAFIVRGMPLFNVECSFRGKILGGLHYKIPPSKIEVT